MQKSGSPARRIRQKDESGFYELYNRLFCVDAWKTMWKTWITSAKTVEIAPLLAWKTGLSQNVGYTFGCKMLNFSGPFFACQAIFQKNITIWIIGFTKIFVLIFRPVF